MSSENRPSGSGGGARILVASTVAAALAIALLYLLLYQPRVRELEEARREASLCVQERAALKARVSDLETMLDELRLGRLLRSGRVGLDGLRATMLALGRLAQALDGLDVELDLNPLFVRPNGEVVAGDAALVARRAEPGRQPPSAA